MPAKAGIQVDFRLGWSVRSLKQWLGQLRMDTGFHRYDGRIKTRVEVIFSEVCVTAKHSKERLAEIKITFSAFF
jgi:hypothetical protein